MGKGASANQVEPMWRLRSPLGLWALAGVALVVLLMGTASAAPASSIVPLTKIKDTPPYSGTSGAEILTEYGGCHDTFGTPVKPVFNLATGHARVWADVSSTSCGAANSSVFMIVEAVFVSAPFTVAASGKHHIRALVGLNFTADLVATPGSVSQAAYAGFFLGAGIGLLDLTNYTAFNSSDSSSYSPFIGDSIIAGTYSHYYPKMHWTSYFNATLVDTHTYQLDWAIEIDVFTLVTPGSSVASASVDMGTDHMHARLASIVIT